MHLDWSKGHHNHNSLVVSDNSLVVKVVVLDDNLDAGVLDVGVLDAVLVVLDVVEAEVLVLDVAEDGL